MTTSAPGVSSVTLNVRDLVGLQGFYRCLLGLEVASQMPGEVRLGVEGRPLLRLISTPELALAPVSRPGLYHTAFLLPTRADLGRWLAHAAGLGLRLGSGDHLVSEAFYLNDPEGNGIEVYADRPREGWTWQGGQVQMDTLPVDVAGVLGSAGVDPQRPDVPADYGAPDGLTVGHVHLKVGDAAQAGEFYAEALGMDLVSRFPGAAFLSWEGYHHHLGLNEWHTRGQGRPGTAAAGLAEVALRVPDLAALRERLKGRDGVQDGGDHLLLTDPWGTRLRLE